MRTNNWPFPLPELPPELDGSNDAKASQEFSSKVFQDFFSFDITKAQETLKKTSAVEWEEQGQKRALNVFHAAAQRVPAYKDFLRKNKINPEKVASFSDFQSVPTINKDSYLNQNSVESLCWDGNFNHSDMISVSSGSSGKPFMWPRDTRLELEVTYFFELIASSFFDIATKKTLIIDCFAMGMYVGGPFFLNGHLRLAQKGYSVTVMTPGNVMDDILRIVLELGSKYEQVILSGYPPFLKDVIENGEDLGVDWTRFKTVLYPAGEGFSESWRDAVAEGAGNKNSKNLFGYYGTADAAVLGVETPWSISIRKLIDGSENLTEIFGQNRMPSFLQYIPTLRYLEVINSNIHITTANGAIPLIRYDIGDNGKVWTHDDLVRQLGENGLSSDIEKDSKLEWQLPYVCVFGRSDHTVVLYGANIYPENVKKALETGVMLRKCSGRFVMEVEEDHHHNQHLNIHVECHQNATPNKRLKEKASSAIQETLLEVNAEYADAAKSIGNRAKPHVFLHEYGDARYFPRQSKQSWKKKPE